MIDDLAGNFVGAGEQLIGRNRRFDQPAPDRFLCIEDPARITPAQGLRQSDDARQKPGTRGFGHQPSAGENRTELCVGRGNPDIHRQRHRQPNANRCAVDRRDRRLAALKNRANEVIATTLLTGLALGEHIVRLTLTETLGTRRDIGTRTEPPPGTGHNDDPHGVIGIGMPKRFSQFTAHPRSVGIEPVGPIERQGHDAVLDADRNIFGIHRCILQEFTPACRHCRRSAGFSCR